MAWGWLGSLRDRFRSPALDWIQVEITTRCNARCGYCPRTARGADWPGRDMPVELFRGLLPLLGRTRHIHLQGWGEPLLHPRFFDMVGWCRARGLAVSTTTNGLLLDEAGLGRLVDLEVDVLGVSLAGVRPESNDARRAGTDMERLRRSLERLAELKARRGVERPAVHLAYMRLADGLGELAALPELARSLGAAKLMISGPHPGATPAFAGGPDPAAVEAACREVAARCAELGLEAFWPARLREITGRVCTENPAGACVVGVDGRVSPCVFSTPVLGRPEAADLVFGDLRRTSLTGVWNAPEYARFRSLFAGRPGTAGGWPVACLGCPLRGTGA